MDTFGPASFLVGVIFLLLLIALLVVGMLRLKGSARALVGAGLGVLILVRVLAPLVQGPLLSSLVAASGYDAYFALTFIWSTIVQLITFIGVGLLVFAAIRAATPAVNRPPAPPTEPWDPPPRTDFSAGPGVPSGGSPGGPTGPP